MLKKFLFPLALLALISAGYFLWWRPSRVAPGPSPAPVDYGADTEFIDSQQTSSDNSVSALEKDIGNTVIPEEDLSDLQ